jgi:outer membrane protein insertion porin family
LNSTQFGCPSQNASVTACTGTQQLTFSPNIVPLAHTNYALRMSTGLELQVILPVVNAPFRVYYAYNPFRVDTEEPSASLITESMFPHDPTTGRLTSAGAHTFLDALANFSPGYRIREPRKTIRFTVATTF